MSSLAAAIDDPARLDAVRATGLLATDGEPALDRLATLVAALLEAPMAFVTLVDAQRSVWTGCAGLTAAAAARRCTPVEDSFCHHVVGEGAPLVLGNARLDRRTRDLPSVTRLGVVAWAGFPVRGAGGEVLGTCCAVDTRPRRWTPAQMATLEELAGVAAREMQLRTALTTAAAEHAALLESEERFRTMAEAAPVMVWTAGVDGRLDWFNGAWLRWRGRTLAEESGDGWAQGLHPDERAKALRRWRRAFAARRPFSWEVRVRRADGRYAWVVDAGAPRFQAGGGFAGYVGTCVDIDDRRRDKARLEAALEAAERARGRVTRLQRITARLAGALNRAEMAQVILVEGRAALGAAACLVVMREGAECRLLAAVGYPEAAVRRLERFPLDAPFPAAVAIRTGDDVIVESRADWEARFGPLLAPFGTGGAAPLMVEGHTIGAIGFRFDEERRPFRDTERTFLETLAGLCAQALARAGRYEAGQELAAALQQSLLPESLPDVPGAELAMRYLAGASPAWVGGDWYEAIPLPGGRVGLSIGDVVGRGPAAAATMGQLRGALRAYALDGASPAQVLAALGRFTQGVRGASVATAAYAILDPASGRLVYACAGHLPPLVVGPGGPPRFLWDGRGAPLGVTLAEGYTDGHAALRPEDALLLYTDGLVERRDEPLDAGLDRLAALVGRVGGAGPAELLERIVAEMLGTRAGEDDVALLVARRSAAATG